jgi:hypothetical protein
VAVCQPLEQFPILVVSVAAHEFTTVCCRFELTQPSAEHEGTVRFSTQGALFKAVTRDKRAILATRILKLQIQAQILCRAQLRRQDNSAASKASVTVLFIDLFLLFRSTPSRSTFDTRPPYMSTSRRYTRECFRRDCRKANKP